MKIIGSVRILTKKELNELRTDMLNSSLLMKAELDRRKAQRHKDIEMRVGYLQKI
ncbi:hypothetical protein [Aeromonas caviae]|uniref:hypothetical protein n=1 Tax=Aeromonas TaxID=642 RepID=UPI000A6FC46A|nr:hypothetical protein [Aeromonas caviae]QUM02835.1 hypothetical protein IMO17_07285 [Aeromonas caviae]